MQAVEERAKAHHYTAIIVDDCPEYFTALGYASAAQHHIISKNDDKSLYVKFLWDRLSEYPWETTTNINRSIKINISKILHDIIDK